MSNLGPFQVNSGRFLVKAVLFDFSVIYMCASVIPESREVRYVYMYVCMLECPTVVKNPPAIATRPVALVALSSACASNIGQIWILRAMRD